MRIAVISDVHGNAIALDAVLKDLGHADAHWILGDLSAIGPDPVGVVERLRTLREVFFVRGNTDRYIVTGERPVPPGHERYAEGDRTFTWAQGAITQAGLLGFFADLPTDARFTLPDGTRVLTVHASPGRDDGAGVGPDTPHSTFDGCGADLVFVGHTHRRVDRTFGTVRVVNPSCVSNYLEEPRAASYVVLEADERAHTIERRLVEYDREAVVDQMRALHFPGTDFVAGMLLGPS